MDALTKKAAQAPSPQFRAEEIKRPSREEAEAAVRVLIAWAGDNPQRDGLIDTPKRVVSAFEEFYAGYGQNAADVLDRTFEDIDRYDDIVLVRDIPFYSHCEHHMVPFIGKAHVAYYPTDAVVGLSKLARVLDIFARRLQSQERLTAEVVSAVDEALKPRGVAVMIEAEHQCMTLRGVQKHGASTVTTQFTGVFRDDPTEQMRFLTLVRGGARPDGPAREIMTASLFAPRGTTADVETGISLAPKFDAHGLITAIATDVASGEVVMVAHMNDEALAKTIATREAWFWSRSRSELWRKGLTSGNTLEVVEMRVDCDQDAVLIKVRIAGDRVACHQGYQSCFYRSVPLGNAPTPATELSFDEAMPRILPKD